MFFVLWRVLGGVAMDGIRGSGCLVQDVSRVGIVQWVGGWLVGPWSRVVLLEEVRVRSTTITSEQKLQIFIHVQKLYRTTPDLFRNTGTKSVPPACGGCSARQPTD